MSDIDIPIEIFMPLDNEEGDMVLKHSWEERPNQLYENWVRYTCLNLVWHKTGTLPEIGREVIIENRRVSGERSIFKGEDERVDIFHEVVRVHDDYLLRYVARHRWAYLDDLLPINNTEEK